MKAEQKSPEVETGRTGYSDAESNVDKKPSLQVDDNGNIWVFTE